ncbi:WW domain-containing oxidoreductase [Zalerion maritima]|uniref:WW domain-containing oxidoreductase n=1 Tax=Zalerion maritima TaxID=339359 RepID=A0AAD5RXX8_9PEZI|nr:WW domain-containing oxidoreductase [Zalerion maritima]
MASSSGPSPPAKTMTGMEVVKKFSSCVGGKNIVVTGVSPSSIGEAAARAIASSVQLPNLLILASRTASKLDAVLHQLRESYPALGQWDILHTVLIDISEQDSVRGAARDIISIISRRGDGKLHVLINNAGINTSHRRYTKDGKVELTFATNHLGPFLLTNLLLPALLEATKENADGRANVKVVTTSSGAHYLSPVRFDDFNFELPRENDSDLPVEQRPVVKAIPEWVRTDTSGFPGLLAYGQSKTANNLFCVALRKRFRSKGIQSFAVHPGLINTGLTRDISCEFQKELDAVPEGMWLSPDQGCSGLLLAAFDPGLSESSEFYISDNRPTRPASHSSRQDMADRLWKLSESLVNGSYRPSANL